MSIQYSPWPDVALEYRSSFTQWLFDNSEGKPNDPCFIDGKTGTVLPSLSLSLPAGAVDEIAYVGGGGQRTTEGETYTFGQVQSNVRRAASALSLYHGFRKGIYLPLRTLKNNCCR